MRYDNEHQRAPQFILLWLATLAFFGFIIWKLLVLLF